MVSVTDHQEELDAEAMALLTAQHLLCRQISVYFSSPGVSVRARGEFLQQPGFRETPAIARALPPDLMRFATLCHGGERWRGTRVVAIPEGSELRCDHAIAADGRFACVVYGPPGRYTVEVERACDLRVLHPAWAQLIDAGRRAAGDRVVMEIIRGRLIIGRIT